jgi:hypothetical protein
VPQRDFDEALAQADKPTTNDILRATAEPKRNPVSAAISPAGAPGHPGKRLSLETFHAYQEIYEATLWGQPVTMAKIAGGANLPVETARRKVQPLLELGRVQRRDDNRYVVAEDFANAAATVDMLDACVAVVCEASQLLLEARNRDQLIGDDLNSPELGHFLGDVIR